MKFETPYNNPEIIYEVTDISEFKTEFARICSNHMFDNMSLWTLMTYNSKKYTKEFIIKMIIDANILKTMNQYISKNENGNFLINSKLYEAVAKNHIQYVYYKFLNLLVDDGFMYLIFENNKFVWKPLKRKRANHEYQ